MREGLGADRLFRRPSSISPGWTRRRRRRGHSFGASRTDVGRWGDPDRHRARGPSVRPVLRPDARVDRPGAGLQRALRLPGQEPLRAEPAARRVLEGDRQDPDGQAPEGSQVPQRSRLHVPGRHRQHHSRQGQVDRALPLRLLRPYRRGAEAIDRQHRQDHLQAGLSAQAGRPHAPLHHPQGGDGRRRHEAGGDRPVQVRELRAGRQARAPALRAVLGEGSAPCWTG